MVEIVFSLSGERMRVHDDVQQGDERVGDDADHSLREEQSDVFSIQHIEWKANHETSRITDTAN